MLDIWLQWEYFSRQWNKKITIFYVDPGNCDGRDLISTTDLLLWLSDNNCDVEIQGGGGALSKGLMWK